MSLITAQIAPSLSDLKAASITDDTIIFDQATFKWRAASSAPADEVNVIASDDAGFWIRQSASNIQAFDGNTAQANLFATGRVLNTDINSTAIGGDVLETAGYSVVGSGAGRYNRLNSGGPFAATRWRQQSQNGNWYELDERTADLTHFGAVDGADCTDAIASAFDWLNEREGRRLIVPRGTFGYRVDMRLLSGKTTIEGFGARSRLQAIDGAKIILGEWVDFDPDNQTTRQVKAGTKIVDVNFRNLILRPAGNHEGPIVIAEYCDSTTFDHVYISADVTAGSGTRTTAIETRAVQWFYVINGCEFNVSDCCFHIRQYQSNAENEDHFGFSNSRFYIGKNAYNEGDTPTVPPAIWRVDKYAGRAAPIWHFDVGPQVHCGRFGIAGTVAVRGLHQINHNSSDQTVMMSPQFFGTWFEYVDVTYDTLTNSVGAVTGNAEFTSCRWLSPDMAFLGPTYSKCAVSVRGCVFEQGVSISQGVKMMFVGKNSHQYFTAPFPAESVNRFRYWNKNNGDSISGVRLIQSGTAQVPAGSDRVTIPLALSLAPDRFNVNILAGWQPGWRVGGISASAMTVVFDDVATSNVNIKWTAEVSEI